MKKSLSFVFVLSLLITLGWINSPVSLEAATSTCAPTVSVAESKKTSVKLKITCTDLKKAKVSIKILVENKDADSDSTKTVKATLGKTGSVTIKVSGLDSATPYTFKVKVKKTSSSGKFSAYSSAVDATTEGADYDVAIEKINGISDDSVKLNIHSSDLEGDKVNVLAAYKKKSDWSTKTFTVTLDGDGDGSVTIDGLKSSTEYSFKVKIRKDGETAYSKYSEIKNATTDDN